MISRRALLKGVGATMLASIAGGTQLAPQIANAQVSSASSDILGISRFNVGDIQITAIKDASSSIDPTIFGTEDQTDGIQAALTTANLPTDQLLNTFNIMMVQTGDDIFLIDTGLGGALVSTMEVLGVSPSDVTGIIGTHWHPDHVGGLSSDGAANFPNAMYYLSQTEYDFVQANIDAFTGDAAAAIAPYADNDQLSLYNSEDEIVAGIQAVAAPGHTPGHHAILMTSGGDQMLHLVDSVISAFVHVPNPTFSIQFDADPQLATETRVALLSRAADEQIPVIGYHFPFPGVGVIARNDDTFRFIAYS